MKISFEKLTDLGLEYGLVPDKYFLQWDQYGSWQLDILKEIGLKPENNIIDIGCGAMRFGIYALNFLDDNKYFGLDAFEPYIPLSKDICNFLKIKKKFNIKFESGFDFSVFNQKFDFAIAQSVLTHLSKEQIELCVNKLKPFMNKNGKFIFTYFSHNKPRGFYYYGSDPMITSQKIDSDYLNSIGTMEGIKFSVLKNTHHPTQNVGFYQF